MSCSSSNQLISASWSRENERCKTGTRPGQRELHVCRRADTSPAARMRQSFTYRTPKSWRSVRLEWADLSWRLYRSEVENV